MYGIIMSMMKIGDADKGGKQSVGCPEYQSIFSKIIMQNGM